MAELVDCKSNGEKGYLKPHLLEGGQDDSCGRVLFSYEKETEGTKGSLVVDDKEPKSKNCTCIQKDNESSIELKNERTIERGGLETDCNKNEEMNPTRRRSSWLRQKLSPVVLGSKKKLLVIGSDGEGHRQEVSTPSSVTKPTLKEFGMQPNRCPPVGIEFQDILLEEAMHNQAKPHERRRRRFWKE